MANETTTPGQSAAANPATERSPASMAQGAAGQQEADIGERAREVRDKLQDQVHELEAQYDQARVRVRELNDRAVTFIQDNPALCIFGALGIGYLVGKLASSRWIE